MTLGAALLDPQLGWSRELGIALLTAGTELLLIEGVAIELPPLGRSLEAFLAVLATSLPVLRHVAPFLTAHIVAVASLLLASAMGALEWPLSSAGPINRAPT